jgi:hypothetical protein
MIIVNISIVIIFIIININLMTAIEHNLFHYSVYEMYFSSNTILLTR